jgi:hypothetical protein
MSKRFGKRTLGCFALVLALVYFSYRVLVWEITEVSPDGKWVAHVRSGLFARNISFEIMSRSSGAKTYRHEYHNSNLIESHTPQIILWYPDSTKLAYFFEGGERRELRLNKVMLESGQWCDDNSTDDLGLIVNMLSQSAARSNGSKRSTMLSLQSDLKADRFDWFRF